MSSMDVVKFKKNNKVNSSATSNKGFYLQEH